MLKELSTAKFWWGLAAILFIYSAFYLLLADNKTTGWQIPASVRHVIKMAVVFAVYFTGTYFLGKLPQPWMGQLWHFIHLSLITVLIGLWAWHFAINPLPVYLRKLGFSIHEFLISPLLYLATGLMGFIAQHQDSTK